MRTQQFSTDISKWVKKAKGGMDEAVRKITFGVFVNISIGSPVDTGRFRGNWMVGLGVRPKGYQPEGFGDLTSTLAAAQAQIWKIKGPGITYIANNVPYAMALERGHSMQAPRGMVIITLDKIDMIVKDALK